MVFAAFHYIWAIARMGRGVAGVAVERGVAQNFHGFGKEGLCPKRP
jgi:hypothetical protein